MPQRPWLVQFHLALWTALAIPTVLAGLLFSAPEIQPLGIILLAAGLSLLVYIWHLAKFNRWAWVVGLIEHSLFLLASLIGLRQAPVLAVGLATLNAWAVMVLLWHRQHWLLSGSAVEKSGSGTP